MPLLLLLAIPAVAFLILIEAIANHLGIGPWQAFFLICLGSFCLFLLGMLAGYLTTNLALEGGNDMFRNSASEQPKPLAPHERPPGWLGFKHRGMRFEFQRVRVGNGVRAYILSHPSYGMRDTNGHDTHRHYDYSRKLYYVCTKWDPETYEESKEWALVWCRYTEHYIRTGKTLT